VALRGLAAVLFGAATLVRLGLALEALVLLFGACALLDGLRQALPVVSAVRDDEALGNGLDDDKQSSPAPARQAAARSEQPLPEVGQPPEEPAVR
jgi:hypothetical protein